MSLFSAKTPPAPAASPPAAAGGYLTLSELAAATGRHAAQICKFAKRPDFPRHEQSGKPVYLLAEVNAWIASNVRSRKQPPASQPPASSPDSPSAAAGTASPPPPRVDAANDPLIQTLLSGTSNALDISRAAVQIAARHLGTSANLSTVEADNLKKALSELRNAEAAYIELEERRRNLIHRDEVKAIVAELCIRLTNVLDTLESRMANELSKWMADPTIAAMTAEERNRTVRRFVASATHTARVEQVDDIERIINQPARNDEQ